jgi:hypothetical protein
MDLRRIVGGPLLWIRGFFDGFGDGHCLSHRHAAVTMLLALDRELDGEDVLALEAPRLMIGARTMGGSGSGWTV